MSRRLLTPSERVAARLITGPLAHFFAWSADAVALLAYYGRQRIKRGSET